MKKLIVIPILSVCLFSQVTYAEKGKVSNKKTVAQKKEQFDFRKAKWGMNHLQIIASEKSEPKFEDDEKIAYNEKMFETDVSINYFFEKDKLIKSEYLFDGTFTNKEDYIVYFRKIKKNLIEKYGRATRDNSSELDIMDRDQYQHISELIYRGVHVYETVWEKPGTTIRIVLKGKDFFTSLKLYVAYNSKKFKEEDNVKEVEKSLF